MWAETRQIDHSSRRLVIAAVLSVILHLIISLIVTSGISLPKLDVPTNRIKVSLRSPAPATPQIAPPSDIKESPVAPETSRLSDKNTVVKEETVKHGDNGGSPAVPSKPQPQTKPAPKKLEKAPTKPPEPKRAPAEAKLFLGDDFVVPAKPQKAAAPEKQRDDMREHKLREMEPFRQNQPSLQGLGIGSSGVPDLVAGVSDGAVTMLNAKADQYAIFVRRVALQVFGALKKSSWSEISFLGIQQIKGFTTVEGIMSPDGQYRDARVMQRSGSDAFDTLVLNAVKKSLWDQNPSKGAVASDGNYHFVFQSRTWARPSARGRGGDERWLILGTGLL